MVMIQLHASKFLEISEQVRDKKLSGLYEAGMIIALITSAIEIDVAVKTLTPFPPIRAEWKQAVSVHEKMKSLLSQWTNGDIKSPQVAEELTPLVVSVNELIAETESILIKEYGITSTSLDFRRQEMINHVNELFSTSEP